MGRRADRSPKKAEVRAEETVGRGDGCLAGREESCQDQSGITDKVIRDVRASHGLKGGH